MVGRKRRSLSGDELDQAVRAMVQLTHLRRLTFSYTGIRDSDLKRLAPLAGQLESLTFNEPWPDFELTGGGVKHLSGWPRLTDVSLHLSDLDEMNFATLTKLPALKRLRLGGGPLDGEDFASIAACPRMESLTFFQCTFSGEALARLKAAKRLRSIGLHNVQARYPPFRPTEREPYIRFEARRSRDVLRKDNWAVPWDRLEKWFHQHLPGVRHSSYFSS